MNIQIKILQTFFILLCTSAGSCNVKTVNEQIVTEEKDTTYLLSGYLINPIKKQVSLYEMTSGSMPGGGHWDGYHYVPDSIINYDSTTLYIIGNQIFFKEQVKFFPELNFNSLRIIYTDLNGDFLCRDKNYLYKNAVCTVIDNDHLYLNNCETIDLSDYKTINNYIYQKGKDLYFLAKHFELEKIEGVTIDIQTIKHLKDNYFADKNGLYLLGGYSYSEDNTSCGYDKSVQLEKSNGKTITPIVELNYLIYGNKVYSPEQYTTHIPLPLNPGKIKELEIGFLADDKRMFTLGSGGYYPYNKVDSSDFWNKNVNQWQVIAVDEYFDEGVENNRTLVKTPNGFYTFLGTLPHTVEKIGKVFIFNFDTKEYEELDASHYRYISNRFRIYKNRIYDYDGVPITNPIDAENLHFITHHGKRTNYMTDGKLLIYARAGVATVEGEGSNKTRALLDKQIISGVDFSTLKVITQDILIDNENIYNGNFDGIGIIPIKALKFNVKIFTE